MSGHHPATVRLAGRKRHARFESSEALAELCRQWRAQPWSCMDAAPGCRLQRRPSANILTAWPGRVDIDLDQLSLRYREAGLLCFGPFESVSRMAQLPFLILVV
jgi:hypothetical protein